LGFVPQTTKRFSVQFCFYKICCQKCGQKCADVHQTTFWNMSR